MCVAFMQTAVAQAGIPAFADIIQGKWPPQFEKALNKSLPIYDPSRNFWGGTEYALFHQGRKGVVVGSDGWLFTDEEFSCEAGGKKNIADNLSFIKNTQVTLARKNTRLAVILVPEKVRVLSSHLYGVTLPVCRISLYKNIMGFLRARHIHAINLLAAMRAAPKDSLYLRTDTHWTPAGAKLAAFSVAGLVKKMPDLNLERRHCVSTSGAVASYNGDLTRYAPGLSPKVLPPDNLSSYTTQCDAKAGLLDDSAAPQITLVGTSYSANPKWNFDGFLEEALQADILNAADEGQGPLTVMDKYLASDLWKNDPPKLLIWEIPERYLLMPHGLAPD